MCLSEIFYFDDTVMYYQICARAMSNHFRKRERPCDDNIKAS